MTAYTENLGDFGIRERAMLAKLLTCENQWPDAFYLKGVKGVANMNSGYVFLVNDDHQCLMMNGDSPELFHSTPYEGHEGLALKALGEKTMPKKLISVSEELRLLQILMHQIIQEHSLYCDSCYDYQLEAKRIKNLTTR